MSRTSNQSLLNESIALLVRHFGVQRVQAALTKISRHSLEAADDQSGRTSKEVRRKLQPGVGAALEQLEHEDEPKYSMLNGFYNRLKRKEILPQPEDIRQFAQMIGVKEIRGKARTDLMTSLMRFLLDLPTERLQGELIRAEGISERQRQQGFSVLTDRLLRD